MANRLKMAKVNAALMLHERGWSNRRIARTLGIDRKTVSEYVRAAAAKRTEAPIGSAIGEDDSKRTIAPPARSPRWTALPRRRRSLRQWPPTAVLATGPTLIRRWLPDSAESPSGGPAGGPPSSCSECSRYRTLIEAKLDEGLSAQRIHQNLVADHGFTGRYWSVRRFVARLEATRPLPFRRMEVGPGEEAQVDFGMGAPIVTSEGRRCYVFRIVLSYSRKAFRRRRDIRGSSKPESIGFFGYSDRTPAGDQVLHSGANAGSVLAFFPRMCCGLFVRDCAREAEAQVAGAAAGVVPVAERRPAEGRADVPTAAPAHPARASWGPRGIVHRRRGVVAAHQTSPDTIPTRCRACRTGPKRSATSDARDASSLRNWHCTTHAPSTPPHRHPSTIVVVVPARQAYSHSASVGSRYSRLSPAPAALTELAAERRCVVPIDHLHGTSRIAP